MDWQTQLLLVGETTFAMLLGEAIGFEREIADKPAGFRTHMLVAGTWLLAGVGLALIEGLNPPGSGRLAVDPSRVIQTIVTGVSIIAAGTIFRTRSNDKVEGLTTSAALLLCSTIGICVALKYLILSVGITILTLIVLRVLAKLEENI
jgi:putative Mg2+ transporter-C (MgtC) family protein